MNRELGPFPALSGLRAGSAEHAGTSPLPSHLSGPRRQEVQGNFARLSDLVTWSLRQTKEGVFGPKSGDFRGNRG